MKKSIKTVVSTGLGAIALATTMVSTLPATAAHADTVRGGVVVSTKPTTGLKTGSVITIKGTKFTPNTAVFIVECKDAAGKVCTTDSAHLKSTKSSATGAISFRYTAYTGVSCKKHKSCYLAVAQADGTKGVIRKLTFA